MWYVAVGKERVASGLESTLPLPVRVDSASGWSNVRKPWWLLDPVSMRAPATELMINGTRAYVEKWHLDLAMLRNGTQAYVKRWHSGLC